MDYLEKHATLQIITEMAAKQNKQPLPELSDKPGLIIPANSLLGPSYQLHVPSEESLEAAEQQPDSVPMQNGSSRPPQQEKPAIAFNIAGPMEEG